MAAESGGSTAPGRTKVRTEEKTAILLPSLDQMRFIREHSGGLFEQDSLRTNLPNRCFFQTLRIWIDTARIENYEARKQSIAKDMKEWLGDLSRLGRNLERLIDGKLAIEAGTNTRHWHRRLKKLAADILGREPDWYAETLPLGLEMCGFGKMGALTIGRQARMIWEAMDGDRTIYLRTLEKKVLRGQIKDFDQRKTCIVKGMGDEVDGLSNLEKNLERLGRNRLRRKAMEYSRRTRKSEGKSFAPHWYTVLADLADGILGHTAGYYEFKLPLAFEFAGYGKEEARALSNRTRDICMERQADEVRARNRPVAEREIFDAFAAQFKSPDKILENLRDENAAAALTKGNVWKMARGVPGHWLHAARAAYRKSHEKADVWLGRDGMLAWLLEGTGWFDKDEGGQEKQDSVLAEATKAAKREGVRNRLESFRENRDRAPADGGGLANLI